jgi:Transglycosylase SLT domain
VGRPQERRPERDDGPETREADAAPARKGSHRPVRSFRAIGAFVLVLGAVAGGYLAFGRAGQSALDNNLSLDVVDVTVPTSASATPAADPSHKQALTDAREKAAAAAADAADRANKAGEAAKRKAEEQPASRSDPRTTAPYPVPASCSDYSGNRATGCAVLLERGFGLDQMPCLDKLFAKESGWNPKARNKSSGAYGIPQALPGTKMATEGADWETNPVTQIKWGLTYIKNRYKTPCAAWAHSQSTGSY